MVTRTLQLYDDVDAALEREAKTAGKSVDDIVNAVLRQYDERSRVVEEGRADVAAGRVVDNADMKSWFESWGATNRVRPHAASDVVTPLATHLEQHPELGRVGVVPATRELILGGTPYVIIYAVSDGRRRRPRRRRRPERLALKRHARRSAICSLAETGSLYAQDREPPRVASFVRRWSAALANTFTPT